MPFYERGPVRIHDEEVGSGFPLLLIPGGGLNSALSSWQTASPFNPMERYQDDFRCICADLRNANPGQSSGPLEIDRPWDAYTDDQLGLMGHLGIREFLVMGFGIGGPMIANHILLAPDTRHGRGGVGRPRRERLGAHRSLAGFAGAHRRGRGARAALPQGARARHSRTLSEGGTGGAEARLLDTEAVGRVVSADLPHLAD